MTVKVVAACSSAALQFSWFRSKSKMSAVGEEDSHLVSKCMDFCRALANQGEAINFSLTIGSSFSFSLDTRSKEMKKSFRTKKASPSTLRRHARRRQDYLIKKQNPPAVNHISGSCSCGTSMWPVWLQGNVWKEAEDPQEDEAWTSPADSSCSYSILPWEPQRARSDELCPQHLPPLPVQQGGELPQLWRSLLSFTSVWIWRGDWGTNITFSTPESTLDHWSRSSQWRQLFYILLPEL